MGFDNLSDELTLSIFSYLDKNGKKAARGVDHRFFDIASDNYVRMCKKIEHYPNFQPTITDQDLMRLVRKEDGGPVHIPRRNALALQHSSHETPLGKLYQIKIATKGCPDDSEWPVWFIDNSATILVRHDGNAELFATEDVAERNFQKPITHPSYDQFLGNSSLHKKCIEDETSESMANSVLL